MSTVVLYCWCHSDSASVLLYFTLVLLARAYAMECHGVCMPNMESLSKTVQKLKRRSKLTTDRQTDNQTDRTKTISPRLFDSGA